MADSINTHNNIEPIDNSNISSSALQSATRIVRLNWLKFLFYSWKRISTLSRFVVVFSILLVMAQIAVGIAMLITSTNENCDQPLRTFIIVYMVRIIISCPFYVGEHFSRENRRVRTHRQRERDRIREQQVRSHRRQQRRQQPQQENHSAQQPANSSNSTRNEETLVSSNASVMSANVQLRSTWFINWGQRFKSVIDLFTILWFIVGNYLLFNSTTCSYSAPRLYFTSLAYVLMGYCIVIIPLILCTSVILCLPCVLVFMREMNLTQVEGMNQGGRKEEIDKISVYRFKIAADEEHETAAAKKPNENNNKDNNNSSTSSTNGPKKSFFSKLIHGYRSHSLEDPEVHYEDLHISSAEDAVCCICLSEYEDSDLLCKLWCGHHFHQSCVTEWLVLNRKCPLCKQDFRGKEYEGGSSSEDENEEGDHELDSLAEGSRTVHPNTSGDNSNHNNPNNS